VDLSRISEFKNLKFLRLNGVYGSDALGKPIILEIQNFNTLRNMQNLTAIQLDYVKINQNEFNEAINSMNNLDDFECNNCGISDVSALEKRTSLKYVNISSADDALYSKCLALVDKKLPNLQVSCSSFS
jgi:Leucine-rich repeat (LRR) protein